MLEILLRKEVVVGNTSQAMPRKEMKKECSNERL
jgi:hypothetical protein